MENPSLSSENNIVAVFDVDHTLITGDSFWPFLTYTAGWPRAFMALARVAFLFAIGYLKHDPEVADHRTFIKAQLLQQLLAGKTLNGLGDAIQKLRGWKKWNEPVKQKLLDHYAQGHKIVIASGGLDLYLPQLLKDLPPHELICTEVEVKENIVTGTMPTGNCVRLRKAEMLDVWLVRHGPFADSWGYGNFPHDVPMLNLVAHRVIVS